MNIPKIQNPRERLYAALFICFSIFMIIFSFFPDVYDYWTREDGPLENGQAITCFLGAYLCIQIFILRKKILSRNDYVLFLGFLVFLFIGGEEISWGQRIFGIKPLLIPGDPNYQRELTLHNIHGLDQWIYGGAIVLTALCAGVLPLLTRFFRPVKQLWLKCGIPLVPLSVIIGLWLGFIFLVLTRHYAYDPAHPLKFVWDVETRIKQWRETYFYMMFMVVVLADYFYLIKYRTIYDFD